MSLLYCIRLTTMLVIIVILRKKYQSSPNGVHLSVIPFFIVVGEFRLDFKNIRDNPPFANSKTFIVRVGGYVEGLGGWVGAKRVLRFSSFFYLLTSKMCWFSNMVTKVIYGFFIKVMSTLNFKYRKFKTDSPYRPMEDDSKIIRQKIRNDLSALQESPWKFQKRLPWK